MDGPEWTTILTILATGTATFLASWCVYLLRERRRKSSFKRSLATEVELNTVTCERIGPSLRTKVDSGAFDNVTTKIASLPLSKVVFEAFRSDLRFLDRDLLQKVLIFYHRLDEANHSIGLSGEFVEPGFARTAANTAIDFLAQAAAEGRSLLPALHPESQAWGAGPITPLQPNIRTLDVKPRDRQPDKTPEK